jgi:uncharacterized delta-60 repeat protein
VKALALAFALALLAATAPSALAAPGDLDLTFSGDGFDTQNVFDADCANDVAIAPDGKIVVVGSCDGGVPTTFSVLRYLPDGNPDQNFGVDGAVNVSFDAPGSPADERAAAVAIQPDGKIVVAGAATLNEAGTSGGGGDNFAVARLLPQDGALDQSFNADGAGANQDGRLVVNMAGIDVGADVALGSDGSIFVGGTPARSTDGDFGIVKLTPQGTLDTSYDSDGKAQLAIGSGDELTAIALQPDGRVVAAGYTGSAPFPSLAERTIALARFTTGGEPDPSFDDDGKRALDLGPAGEQAKGLAIDSSGRIVVGGFAGSGTETAVARLLEGNGATDLTFSEDGGTTVDTGAADAGYDVAVLPGGAIAVAGDTESGPTPNNAFVALLREDGTPDAGFGNQPGLPGVAIHDFGGSDHFEALSVQADNRLVAAGWVPAEDFLTARLQGPAPAGPPPGPDITPPGVTSLAITRVFAAAARGGAIAGAPRRVPVGATIRYGLSEAATTRFSVERARPGRRVRGRCGTPTRRNRSHQKCTRYVRVRGSFVHHGAVGPNKFRFSGRLRKRKLASGRYRLVAVATDSAGNRSAAKRRTFRIVRRR